MNKPMTVQSKKSKLATDPIKTRKKPNTNIKISEYEKYFVPVANQPENFHIFTMTDWATPIFTGNHT